MPEIYTSHILDLLNFNHLNYRPLNLESQPRKQASWLAWPLSGGRHRAETYSDRQPVPRLAASIMERAGSFINCLMTDACFPLMG